MTTILGGTTMLASGWVLGSSSDPSFGDNTGCRIGLVTPGSSAGAAGLEQGDVILKLNGEEVRDFDHLVELLKQFERGNTVTMTIRRSGGAFQSRPNQPFGRNPVLDIPVVLKGWDELE